MKKIFEVNHTLWGRAFSTLTRHQLRDMCETYGVDHKGMSREQMGVILAQKVNISGDRMQLVCDMDEPFSLSNNK